MTGIFVQGQMVLKCPVKNLSEDLKMSILNVQVVNNQIDC